MKNKLFTDVYNKYHRLVIKAALDQTGILSWHKKSANMYFGNIMTIWIQWRLILLRRGF